MRRLALAALLAACSDDGATPRGDAAIDAAIDAEVGPDSTVTSGAWGTPTVVSIPPPTNLDDDVTLVADRLELYLNSARNGNYDIFRLRRETTSDPWGPLVLVPLVSTLSLETTPKVHPDGLAIVFSTDRVTTNQFDLWMATRASRSDPWRAPTELTPLASPMVEYGGSMTADQRAIAFASNRLGTMDLFIAERASPSDPFGTPVEQTALNSTTYLDSSPWFSPDGLTLYFESDRGGTSDLYIARRAQRSDAFGAPELIAELSTSTATEQDIWVSPDGHHITFTSNRSGAVQIWEASR